METRVAAALLCRTSEFGRPSHFGLSLLRRLPIADVPAQDVGAARTPRLCKKAMLACWLLWPQLKHLKLLLRRPSVDAVITMAFESLELRITYRDAMCSSILNLPTSVVVS
jgi:hypothetical protein